MKRFSCFRHGRHMALALAALILAGLPSVSRAEAPQPEGVAVLDIQTSGNVDATRFAPLSSILGTEAARYPELRVVTGADIRNMLGFEAQRQLLGCETDSTCLAEIGGALGVPYVLASEIAVFGDRLHLTLSLLDVENSVPVSRVGLRAETEAELADQLPGGVREVLASLIGPDHAVPVPRRPAARTPAPRGRILSWTAVGVGSAVAIGGGALYGNGWSVKRRHEESVQEGAPLLTHDQARAVEGRAGLGLGLIAGGSAIIATGLVLPRLLPDASGRQALAGPEDGEVRVAVTALPLPDGGMVALGVMRW
jgi:TolB-like protein